MVERSLGTRQDEGAATLGGRGAVEEVKGLGDEGEASTSSAVNGPRPWYTASGLWWPLVRITAAAVASWCSVVP